MKLNNQRQYQFPLIETEQPTSSNEFADSEAFLQKVPEGSKIQLVNQEAIVHKLSHQHLHTRFWIVQTESHLEASVHWNDIETYPVPVLISNFIEKFDYKSHQNF